MIWIYLFCGLSLFFLLVFLMLVHWRLSWRAALGMTFVIMLTSSTFYWLRHDKSVFTHFYAQQKVNQLLANTSQPALLESHKDIDLLPDLIRTLQIKLQQQPKDATLWHELANQFMQFELISSALLAAEKAHYFAPEQIKYKVHLAQLLVLSNHGKLTEESAHLLKQSLVSNPQHQGALMLLGMAAFGAEDYELAISSWRKLLAMRDLGSEGAKLLSDSIARAEVLAKMQKEQSTIKVKLVLPTELKKVDLNHFRYVYVFAKASQTDQAPIAAKKIPFNGIDNIIALTDQDAMLANQSLFQHETLYLFARLSPHDDATNKTGVLQGQQIVKKPYEQTIRLELNQLL